MVANQSDTTLLSVRVWMCVKSRSGSSELGSVGRYTLSSHMRVGAIAAVAHWEIKSVRQPSHLGSGFDKCGSREG